jgi:uracil-DNA glycosylase
MIGLSSRRASVGNANRMASQIDHRLGTLQEVESLRWWSRVGITNALDEVPHDRFGANPAEEGGVHTAPPISDPKQKSSHSLSETRSSTIQNGGLRKLLDTAEISARALAQETTDLEMLRSVMAEFDGCALKGTATQLVFADGAPGSRIMFVGEAPGEGEDRSGRPFVGRAGQLLDRMLGTIGLDRRKVYIANVVPWRPPGNRTPTPQETQICLPFIERQIELADPEYLVCLGGSAARALLGVQGGIMRARGSWLPYPRQTRREIQALSMLHPAFLLRQPAHKRSAWADLRALARALETRSR